MQSFNIKWHRFSGNMSKLSGKLSKASWPASSLRGPCHWISSLQAPCCPKSPGVEESYSSRASAVSQGTRCVLWECFETKWVSVVIYIQNLFHAYFQIVEIWPSKSLKIQTQFSFTWIKENTYNSNCNGKQSWNKLSLRFLLWLSEILK